MTLDEIKEAVSQVSFMNYRFLVRQDGTRPYLQAEYIDADIVTGFAAMQSTRKWILSFHMTKSEIIQTCFKLVMTSMEHRAREGFLYKECRVFGPHFDVDALADLCLKGSLDYREPPSIAALNAEYTLGREDGFDAGRLRERQEANK